jgi:hypothetical protein
LAASGSARAASATPAATPPATTTTTAATAGAHAPWRTVAGALPAALALPLPLARETVSADVAERRFHWIGLRLGRLPVGALAGVIPVETVAIAPRPTSPGRSRGHR